MKAIVATDQAAGTVGMKLVERPEPQAGINDVVVQIHASAFTGDELTWPSTWTDRAGRDRTPSIPGHEVAGVVTALGYGTTGLSVGQRVFGLTDWYRDGALAEYVAVLVRKNGNQIAEHMRRGRKSVQEQNGGTVVKTGFAVKDVQSLHVKLSIKNGWRSRVRHLNSSSVCESHLQEANL